MLFACSIQQDGEVVTVETEYGVSLRCELSGPVICYVILNTHRNGTLGE